MFCPMARLCAVVLTLMANGPLAICRTLLKATAEYGDLFAL